MRRLDHAAARSLTQGRARPAVIAPSGSRIPPRIVWLDQVFDDQMLDPFCTRCAFFLSQHFNWDDRGTCFPFQRTLAERARISERKVTSAIKALRDRGHLVATSGGNRRLGLQMWPVFFGVSGIALGVSESLLRPGDPTPTHRSKWPSSARRRSRISSASHADETAATAQANAFHPQAVQMAIRPPVREGTLERGPIGHSSAAQGAAKSAPAFDRGAAMRGLVAELLRHQGPPADPDEKPRDDIDH